MSAVGRTLLLVTGAVALAASATACTSAAGFQRTCLELSPGTPHRRVDERLRAAGGRRPWVDATGAHHWERRKGWSSRIAVCKATFDRSDRASRVTYDEHNDLL